MIYIYIYGQTCVYIYIIVTARVEDPAHVPRGSPVRYITSEF